MTAESISSYESNDNVRDLRVIKVSEGLSERAMRVIPPVVYWGPNERRIPEVTPLRSSRIEESPRHDFDDN